MRFSEELRSATEPVWRAIFNHPMLQQIRDGSLPIEKFKGFLSQDWHYLDAFARCVGLAIGKAREAGMLEHLAGRLVKPVEKSLHRKLLGLLQVDLGAMAAVQIAPTNLAYMNHMLVTASLGTLGETAAALLPCPWTYHEIGKRLGAVPHPVYAEWAAFYAAGGLSESVMAWTELVDRTGAMAGPPEQAGMRQAFLTSCRYEYLFWEMAAREEAWPV